MLSLIFATINEEKRRWEKDVMPSREIINLGHGMSFVKRQNDATDVADELL